MNKRMTILAAAGLLTIGLTNAQRSMDRQMQHPDGMMTVKHSLVKGKPENVVFGKVPVMETPHAMESNQVLEFNGQRYYYNQGNFFIFNGGRYLLVAPPTSLTLDTIPKDNTQLGENIFFSKGIFYKKVATGYEVIKEPLGAIIYELPAAVDVVTVGDKAYYNYLGVLYEKVLVQGEQAFEVVGVLTESS